ncbi:MAG: hypothetical protein KGO96_10395 [Elusimicrobia bacterium]|nr:hypothetical protein [Elusimicrobiota bacterium]
MTAAVHPIPPGLFCIPAALCALTGEDLMSVIVPSLNRHGGGQGLVDTVAGTTMHAAVEVLEEIGFTVRSYKSSAEAGPLKARISTWARRSQDRWPGRLLLVATSGHCLVIADGCVYDTHSPMGESGETHPYARARATWAALVTRRQK